MDRPVLFRKSRLNTLFFRVFERFVESKKIKSKNFQEKDDMSVSCHGVRKMVGAP